MNKNQHISLILLLLSFCCFTLIPSIRNELSTVLFLINYSICFVLYYLVIKNEIRLPISKIILIYFITRTVIFPMNAWLSDDVFTYLWQGKLWYNGINIYEYFPLDKALTQYHDLNFYKMGNIGVPAIYPPISVYFFSLNYWISNLFSSSEILQFYTWKFLLIIVEFLSMFSIIKFTEINKNNLLIYILCPLPLIELIGQGHNDALILPIISLIIIISNKIHNSTLQKLLIFSSILLGVAIKLVPIFWLPILMLKKQMIGSNQKFSYTHLQINFKENFLKKVFQIAPNSYQIYPPTIIILLTLSIIFISILPFCNNPIALENFKYGMNYYNFQASFFSAPLELVKYLLSSINVEEYWILAPKIIYYLKFATIIGLIIFSIKTKKLDFLDIISYSLLATYLISTKVHPWYFVPPIFILSISNKKRIIYALMISIYSYYVYLFPNFTQFPIVDIAIWAIGIMIFLAQKPSKY